MANYFNTLNLRQQLAQLGKCRFMQREEFADGCAALKGKKVVIVGCGAQGLNQGLNMRDSGLDISYALRKAAITEKRASWQKVTDNGFVVQDGQRRTLTEPEYFVTRKGRRSIEAGPFTNRDQAVEAARGLVKRGGAGGVKPEEVVKLERAVRTGAPVRAPNEDISSERLAQTFGFRGINFGNWMQGNSAAAERQAHLNHAYDSFQDLAAVMGVPKRAEKAALMPHMVSTLPSPGFM